MLGVDDFNGRDFDDNCCALDFLLEAASVASDKLERESLVKIDQIFNQALSLTKKRSRIGEKSPPFSMKEWFIGQEPVQEAVETKSDDKIIKKQFLGSQSDDMSMKEQFLGIQAKKERFMAEKILKKPARNNAKRDRDMDFGDINCQESGLKFKRRKRNLDFGAMPLELQDRIKNMGGSKVVRVIKKSLFKTDVNPSEARLSIPLNQVREEFLTEKEKGVLDKRNGRHLEDIEVMLIEPSLNQSKLWLRRWNYGSSKSYALCGWNPVVKRNELKEDDIIQLWSFRVGLELWFAMVVVETNERERC